MGRQQEVADDPGDPHDKKSHQQAEQRLAQQRRPIEDKEGTDAAEGKGRHQPDRKRETQSDDAQTVPYGFQGEGVEPRPDPLRRLAKQPFDTDAQTDEESEEEQRLGPAVFAEVCGDEVVTSLELVWEIGDRARESNDVLADCRETAIEFLRNRLLGRRLLRCSFRLALFFKPIAHLRIGEQRHQFLDLLRRRFFARRRFRRLLRRCETGARQHSRQNYRTKRDRGG